MNCYHSHSSQCKVPAMCVATHGGFSHPRDDIGNLRCLECELVAVKKDRDALATEVVVLRLRQPSKSVECRLLKKIIDEAPDNLVIDLLKKVVDITLKVNLSKDEVELLDRLGYDVQEVE